MRPLAEELARSASGRPPTLDAGGHAAGRCRGRRRPPGGGAGGGRRRARGWPRPRYLDRLAAAAAELGAALDAYELELGSSAAAHEAAGGATPAQLAPAWRALAAVARRPATRATCSALAGGHPGAVEALVGRGGGALPRAARMICPCSIVDRLIATHAAGRAAAASCAASPTATWPARRLADAVAHGRPAEPARRRRRRSTCWASSSASREQAARDGRASTWRLLDAIAAHRPRRQRLGQADRARPGDRPGARAASNLAGCVAGAPRHHGQLRAHRHGAHPPSPTRRSRSTASCARRATTASASSSSRTCAARSTTSARWPT